MSVEDHGRRCPNCEQRTTGFLVTGETGVRHCGCFYGSDPTVHFHVSREHVNRPTEEEGGPRHWSGAGAHVQAIRWVAGADGPEPPTLKTDE